MSRWVWCLCAATGLAGCAAQEDEAGDGCTVADCAAQCYGAGYSSGDCNDGMCVCLGGPRRDGGSDGDAGRTDDGDAGTDDAGDTAPPRDSAGDADADSSAEADAEAEGGRDAWPDTYYPDDAGDELNCAGFMECGSMCVDETCIMECFDRMCATAQTEYENLALCIETNCATECGEYGDPDACNTCAYDLCETEVYACFESEC
jgi:hypothetical protein